ncbi:hypothetical protein SYYSPA8_13515 [Streptomyces yaizuensis]|uniref:Uncharacterized protein n=1 Tax=Streptomyces yaizuensis TaxID=2989713 RepID=A0ABQ5NY83_9ACTN|nr:hypothetical protein SYYSPA8_13515 [Streptomyces sp. YSPA8]
MDGLLRGEPRVGVFGGVGDGAVDAADGVVGGEGEGTAAAPSPDLQQRVRHQRQSAGLRGRLCHDPRGQLPFHDQTGRTCRADHRLAQLSRIHRAKGEVCGAQDADQGGVLGAVAVEVGAHGDHHAQSAVRFAGREQLVEETGAFFRVLAEGEDLLELVDHHDRVPGRDPPPGAAGTTGGCFGSGGAPRLGLPEVGGGEGLGVCGGRAGARCDDPDRRAGHRGVPGVLECRDQSRSEEGGFAAAGGPCEDHHPVGGDEFDEAVEEFLTAEEEVAVGGLEAGQPPVRGLTGRGVVDDPDRPLLDHTGGLVPAGLPRGRIPSADRHIGEDQGERGQFVAPRGGG